MATKNWRQGIHAFDPCIHRLRKRSARAFTVSLAVSLSCHALLAAAMIFLAGQPTAHVFLLVESGEDAVETETGSLYASRPRRKRDEVPEKRFHESVEENAPERREAPLPDEDAAVLAANAGRPEKISWLATHDAEPPRLPRRWTRDEKPEPKQPATLDPAGRLAAEQSTVSAIGGSALPRGARQRARPRGALVPRYPVSSRRRGESGVVTVRAMIDAAGRCLWARIESGSGYTVLDNAALDTVRRASFQPASENGLAIPAEERFAIEFRLR